MNNQIYIIGGKDGRCYLAFCERYDPTTDQWDKLAPLNKARSNALLVVKNEMIFAISGESEDGETRLVERYDSKRNSWEILPELNKPRLASSAVSYCGNIWVIGGSYNLEIYDSIEILSNNGWVEPPFTLTTKRARHTSIVHQKILYNFGGYDGRRFLNTIEKYQPDNEIFVLLENNHLLKARSRSSICCSNGEIYIFGGFDNLGNSLRDSEIIDFREGFEIRSGPKMKFSRGYVSVASLFT